MTDTAAPPSAQQAAARVLASHRLVAPSAQSDWNARCTCSRETGWNGVNFDQHAIHLAGTLAAVGLLREDPAPAADEDPLAGVGIGDPDPTADRGNYDLDCLYDWPGGWGCTREPGHPGQHIAGDGDTVCAVLPAGAGS